MEMSHRYGIIDTNERENVLRVAPSTKPRRLLKVYLYLSLSSRPTSSNDDIIETRFTYAYQSSLLILIQIESLN